MMRICIEEAGEHVGEMIRGESRGFALIGDSKDCRSAVRASRVSRLIIESPITKSNYR